MSDKQPLRYEDGAFPVKVVNDAGEVIESGWMSARTRTYYTARHGDAEHYARLHDATDRPCETDGCAGRAEKYRRFCATCKSRIDAEWWAKAMAEKGIDWDGETPLVVEGTGDTFLWSEDEVSDYLDTWLADGNALEDVRLVLAKKSNPPSFEVVDFLSDYLSEDADVRGHDIDKQVDDWIAANVPQMWTDTTTPIRPESLKAHVPEPCEEVDESKGTDLLGSPGRGAVMRISVDGQAGELPPGRCTGADIKNAADVPRTYQLFRRNAGDGDDTPVADNQWIVPVENETFYAVPPCTGA